MSDSPEHVGMAAANFAVFEEAQAQFAVDILREVGQNSTTIISPISIVLALSLAYAGSKGETRSQFNTVFAKGKPDSHLDDFFQSSLTQLGSLKNVTLETANRAYAEKTLKILDSYKKVINEKYNGGFEQVDFINDKEHAVQQINQFVSNATHNKINNLISSDAVDSLTRLILINAIYFKGDWKTKFNKNSTSNQSFYISENSETKVRMMKRRLDARYFEDDEVQILELPYVDSSVSFVAFLPKNKFGLSSFIQSLTGEKLLNLTSKLWKQEVDVELPRFKIEKSFSLKETLQKLGLDKGFSENANFKGITDDSNNALYIDSVVHKGFIELNEEGSEAAGASGAVLTTRMRPAPPPTPKVWKGDHQFLFGIFLKDAPLFLGYFGGV